VIERRSRALLFVRASSPLLLPAYSERQEECHLSLVFRHIKSLSWNRSCADSFL